MSNLSISKEHGISFSKARLHELFAQIEREYEILWEENQELKSKLGMLAGITASVSAPGSPANRLKLPDSRGGLKLPKMKLPKNVKPPSKKAVQKWVKVKDFLGHRDGIWEVTACPWDVGYFGSASADHSARLWSADGTRNSVLYLGHTGSVNSIRFHPTERLVCTSSGDRTCHIWKVPLPLFIQPKVPAIQFSQQPNKIPGKAGNKLWTPLLERDHAKDEGSGLSIPDGTQSLSSSPGSPAFIEAAMPRGAATPLNISAGNLPTLSGLHHTNESIPPTIEEDPFPPQPNVTVYRSPFIELKGHTGAVVGASWLSAGASVVTASWDNTVRLWSLDSPERPISVIAAGHDKSQRITHLSSQPTSTLVVFSSTDGAFRIWDTRNNQGPLETVVAHQGPVTSCILSHDGSTIISGGEDRMVKIWDARNAKTPRNVFRCHAAVNKMSISPTTSSLLIPTDERRVSIYDINGVIKAKFHNQEKIGHKFMVTSTAWSMDESVVYTTGFDRKIIAWAQQM